MKRRLIAILAITLTLIVMLSLPAVAETERSVDASVTVSEPEIINITLTDAGVAGIQFGSVAPSDIEIHGDVAQIVGTPAIKVNVAAETNVQVDISIMGSTTGALALSNWKYSKLFDKSDIASITGSYTEAYDNVGDGSY